MKDQNLSPKVLALYEAVRQLMEEEPDIKNLKVSDITNRAGIGKGTAYEYFTNKEEIISSALFYQMDLICSRIKEYFNSLKSFCGRIQYILCYMDDEIMQRDCFIKFVHIMSDNGLISRLLQEKIKNRGADSCMPEDLLEKIIEEGIQSGEIKEKLPRAYMNMTIASKLMVYAIYLGRTDDEEIGGKPKMHQLICDSLIKEFN